MKRRGYIGPLAVMGHHQFLFLPTLIVLMVSGQPVPRETPTFGSILLDSLSGYARSSVSQDAGSVASADRELLREYGVLAADHAVYVNSAGHRMDVEVFQFGTSEGGHAAWLSLLPPVTAGSPLAEFSEKTGVFGQTYAVVGGGTTVVGRNNYVFRFKGSAPSNREMGAMLDRLPGLDPSKPSRGECCRYFVESSERILLGPVSLAKFAPQVPASVAGFGQGARGRVARFETPAGPMSKTVFEYASPDAAQERLSALRALPGAYVKIAGSKIGVIFYPADWQEADDILGDIDSNVTAGTISFDPRFMTDTLPTLGEAMAGTLVGGALGCLIAVLLHLAQRREGIQDRTIALHIGEGQS